MGSKLIYVFSICAILNFSNCFAAEEETTKVLLNKTTRIYDFRPDYPELLKSYVVPAGFTIECATPIKERFFDGMLCVPYDGSSISAELKKGGIQRKISITVTLSGNKNLKSNYQYATPERMKKSIEKRATGEESSSGFDIVNKGVFSKKDDGYHFFADIKTTINKATKEEVASRRIAGVNFPCEFMVGMSERSLKNEYIKIEKYKFTDIADSIYRSMRCELKEKEQIEKELKSK